MSVQEISQKQLAPESTKTKRAREKLQKYWDDIEKQITPEALRKKTEEIQRWIARHAQMRVPLKVKFSLFDENQNAAAISKRVNELAKKLRQML